ncbi:E3 ubiquitin-protein ligase RGLG2-like protein [Carex littledalei]|uniref:E3 ubiquitin-protein ligase RGLG2-like protein n=1 Tax=Carex littledalei TaxID=544730 RepID=A0A833QKB8_9POAL|nr:E3 ubiquitin-protein ligase RGLG2-like protein [Carex littledalei]
MGAKESRPCSSSSSSSQYGYSSGSGYGNTENTAAGYGNNYPGYGNSAPGYGNNASGYGDRYGSNYNSGYSSYDNHSNQARSENNGGRVQNKYSHIGDDYRTLNQVTDALAHAGLESSNLIVGIDFTKSNEWTGKLSFGRRCLHNIGSTPNPYEQAISIIGRTLSAFDEDNLIPCFGFGDASTHDQEVFSFYPDNRPCNGFEEALDRYKEVVPNLRLAGPTSFAPIIETAIGIVDSTGGQYHVLLIIADGQVTRSVDTQSGQLSPQERATVDAIVKASQYPLSIVVVGVGDGPWDMMHEFDDNIPSRAFDNFQFVNFTEIMSKSIPTERKEAEFALAALMEIPSQYKATIDLQLLGRRRGIPPRVCLPPPSRNSYSRGNSFNQRPPSTPTYVSRPSTPPYSSESTLEDKLLCPICMWKSKDCAFGCGHQSS